MKKPSIDLLIQGLKKLYPHAECALLHENPFQLLVATILSAQCTDARVNQVTPQLFRKFPDPQSMSKASLQELEELIRSTGFFRSKAKSLKGSSEALVKKFGGKVPENMSDLSQLPGVGRKTANVVLGNAFDKPDGVVVDTHVKRLSNRLGLSRQKSPDKIEQDLNKLVPQKDWVMFSHWLIHHGRQVCMARNPQCARCGLRELCPRVGVR